MSNRHFRFSFSKKLFWLFIWKKKEIGKPGNLKVGVPLTKIRKKISVCLILLEFYTGLNFIVKRMEEILQ